MDSKVEQLLLQAESLRTKFEQGGGISYIDEAIVLDREALELSPPGHDNRTISLTSLASHLWFRHSQLGATMDIEEAIDLDREALELRQQGHPDRPGSLDNLASRLYARYKQLRAMEDINEAIILTREALVLFPPEHNNRSFSLSNLALYLSTRYDQLGSMEDLNEAIALDEEALSLRPQGHPFRSSSLNNLALHLSSRYDQFGATEDLNEAIFLGREAVALRPPGHLERSLSLSNLAAYLFTRYNRLTSIEDLNEVIVLDRDALALRPPGHLDRPTSLNNLAFHLSIRFSDLGATVDLNEAIALGRDALALCPPGHPHRSSCLTNLALHLSTRYKQLGGTEDINEAIVLDRDALTLCPPGHPGRSTFLNNLANHLTTRYRQLGGIGDLNEAIALNRDALALRPPGHPDRSVTLGNLAFHLTARFDQFGTMKDLNDAIVLCREALALCPPGDFRRPYSLYFLACRLHARFMHSSDEQDREEAFNLYSELAQVSQTATSGDLDATKAWIYAAECFQHPTTLLAYETVLRCLVHHLAILPSLPQNIDALKSSASSYAIDAFSAALRYHSPTKAVELLEQGRSVFWSLLSRLRSSLDEVIASGLAGQTLAEKFTQLTSHIRNALDSPGAYQHDRVYQLNIELQGVVSDIRKLPGLSHFLLPSLFSDLRQAAREGPVIIVNASQYGCDALVVLADQDPAHIPLSITKEHVRQLSLNLRTLTVRTKTMNMTNQFAILLRELWDTVVSPIVAFLRTRFPRGSRIWWCPTAEFSLLPMHAAGPYRKGQQNLSNIYISSYTLTLTALNRARRSSPSIPGPTEKHFVAVGQATALGENQLVSVGTELDNIGQHVAGRATFTRIEGTDSSISRFTDELKKNEWVHLACHGLPNRKQPFESAFALYDGHFTIERIMRCELENPEFAYLSACHTTVGDEGGPDEVIHLASAMQFAGFRSVIGTMWAVDDAETNKITSLFYDNMVNESGQLDHTRAALALHKTMRQLASIPFDQRILYIHLGA